jgi:Flavodoxin-like fold
MRLLVLNGSPRGERSNTDVVLAPFLAGFHEHPGHEHEVLHLVRSADRERQLRAFSAADAVLVAFPLYVDAMPAPALELAGALAPLCGRAGNPRLLFLVQSGFPEAFHARPVERWAEKLARRLGSPYAGTMVRGGVEGIQAKPPWMTRRLLEQLRVLGRGFGATGALSPQALARLARPERLRLPARLAYRGAGALGLLDLYWDWSLRRNGAFAERDARPYANPPR